MLVDFKSGVIEWSVNGGVRTTAENERLRDITIKWVPYIYIRKQSVVAIVK